MALSQMKVFFARLGGRDIPLAYNWYSNFGFNSTYDETSREYTEYGDPIYKHSLMDVLNNFDKPITFNTVDKLGTLKSVSDLTIVETDGNEDAKNIIISSTFWKKVLKLFEYIYENQAEWKNVPVGSSTTQVPFSCRGDEVLRTDNTYADAASIYRDGTLVVNTSSSELLSSRILSCELKITNANLSEEDRNQDANTIANTISVTLYFNPDTYIIQGATRNYAVYSYEDLSNPKDEKIDDVLLNVYSSEGSAAKTEFQVNIIDKIHEIEKTGKFKRVIRFCPTGGTAGTTFYIDKGKYGVKDGASVLFTDSSETEIITQENCGEYGYNKPFYIFTSLDESQPLDDTTIIGYIKNYINTKMYPDTVTNTAQMVERNLRFPNLFIDTTVSIYPITGNYEPNSSAKLKSPLDGKTLATFLSKASITDSQYEIFYLGKAVYSGGSSQFTEVPMIATEHDTSSTSDHPITSRFPSFRPINSATAEDNMDMDSDTIILHDLCVLALSVLMGQRPGEINDTININGTVYDFVTGLTDFKEIEAGYSPIDGIYVNHSVQFTFKNIRYKFIDLETN
jgi:hypothetical protein